MISLHLFADYYDILLSKYEKRSQENIVINYESMALKDSIKRVISCLVNELLVASSLIRIPKKLRKNNLKDLFWVVLYANRNVNYIIWAPLIVEITEQNINFDLKTGSVKFLDPNDVSGIVFISEIKNQLIRFESVTNVKQIFELLVMNGSNALKVDAIINEVNNSINNQILAYKQTKSFVPLWRPAIEYELAIVEGHHTHPMNKARVPVNQITSDLGLYDFKKIKIRFYIVPKSAMNIYGYYENIMEIVAKKFCILYNRETETIIPVHELQTKVINNYFDDVGLEESTSVYALSQSSLRTVNIDNVSDYSFKLALGIIITSSMRTITHWSIYQGVYLRPVIDKIIENNEILTVLEEVGSIIIKNDDFNVSKHLACIIRENVNIKLSDPLETAIVSAYLTEKCDTEFNITKLFHLNAQTDRDNFSCLYAKLLIDAFFGVVYKYGFSFEAHQQNVLLRVRKDADHGYNLIGFIVRDFGGIIVHQETLRSKIGITVSVLNDKASCLADNLESVYKVCYHTLFHSHLQQIFKSLGTHDNGRGWQFVRQHLKTKKEFLKNERCVKFFFAKMARLKCFMKMKLIDYERDYLYTDVPNVINFIGI